jgi:hypothetical protein
LQLRGFAAFSGLRFADRAAMKAITFTAMKDGKGYVKTALVAGNRSEGQRADTWGMVIAGGLLLVTATFICLLLFGA